MILKAQNALDIFQEELQKDIGSPVIVELNAIPVEMINYESGRDHNDPKKFISPEEREESSIETKILDDMTK